MIDRLILSAVLSTAGWHGLYPDPPEPTQLTLRQKAKQNSMSAMCAKKKHGKQAAELCKRWKEQQRA